MANTGRVDTYEDQLKGQLYRNWVKAGLAPKFLKEGLETFVDNIIKDLQIFFLSDICNTLGVVNEKCTVCTTANVLPCPTFGICNLRRKGGKCSYHVSHNQKLVHSKCPKNICDKLHEKIRLLHRFQPPSWKNTDAQQWCTNHWEIAKCFMSPTGYEDKASIQETDCTGVLNIAINCLYVQKYLDVYIDPHNDVLSKIIKTRNDVVHSATMELTEDELDEYIGLMITLLRDKKILVNDPSAQNAIMKLKQECTFCITTKDETEICDEAVQAAKQREHDDYLGRKKELQLGLCSMYDTHFRQIPISPLLECVTEDLDDVFVELFICDDLTHENQFKKRKKMSDTGKRITKLEEIFCKTVGSTICKHIYVVGDAGMGKTTWCMKLLNTWVSACNKVRQVRSLNTKLTEDETMILDFDVVLFVALRHGLHDGNIRDMIKHQLFEEQRNLDTLTSEVLDREPGRCLIVIDGLDEWSSPEDFNPHSLLQHPQLPGRKDLNGCPCLTTTRPWKLDDLRLSDAQIDRAVRIEGIEDASRLAEKVIQARSGDVSKQNASKTDQTSFEHFQHRLSGLSFNRLSVWKELDFLKIPLILLFVVCIWLDEKTIASTWTRNFTLILECLIKKDDVNKRSGRPGRLCNIDNLKSLQKQWEKSKTSLPNCLQNENVVKYSELIIRLAKLAFENLICSKKENNLVFNKLALKEFLSESELEVAVKIGILSQSQVVGKTLTKESSVSFLHKTLQEYFAAVFLCSDIPEKVAALHSFLSYCHDLDHVYSVENVILFVFGLNSRIASEVSKHMTKFDMQDTHGLYVYRRISVKCQHEFQASFQVHNHKIELCNLYGASISFSVERKFRLELFKTNWYVVKNDETTPNAAHDSKLEDVHNTAKWLPNLIGDILKLNPSKTTNSVTELLCGNTLKSKEKNEVNLNDFCEINEIMLRKTSYYIIKLSKHFTNILLVEASDCYIEVKGNAYFGPERNAIKESDDKLCADTADRTIKQSKQTHVKSKGKFCELQSDEVNDQEDVFVEKIEIERCKFCDIEIAQNDQKTKKTNNNVMKIGRIFITDSHESKLFCSDKCKIDMVKYKSCRECKFEYRVNNSTSQMSERYINDNRFLYQTNTLLFDQCDACELQIVILDPLSIINSIKQCFEKEQQLHMVEFKNCKCCNVSSNSEVLVCYPTLLIQLLAIEFSNDQHIVRISIENVCNFTKVNIASSKDFLSKQTGRHDMSQIIQPIKEIKELTLGNCAEETFEILSQVLNSFVFLEKVTLRHSSDLKRRSKERIYEESSLSWLPKKETEDSTIQETTVNVISQMDKLKHLELVGLSLDAYDAMASCLSSTFRLENLYISNETTFIPKSFIDSIRYQSKLKLLKLDHVPEHCLATFSESLKKLTKLETLSIHIDPIHVSGSVILSTQQLPKGDNGSLAEILSSKTCDLSTNDECDLSTELVRSTRYLSNLKHLKLHGLTTEGSEALAESVPIITWLETLDISSHKSTHQMRDEAVLSLEFIYSTKQLTNLKDLKLSVLNRKASEALADSISCLTKLETIHISASCHHSLSTELMFSIKHPTDLKHLILTGLDTEASEALADSLPILTRIQTLDISCRPGYTLSYKLMSSIKDLTNLKNLCFNCLDREASKALANSLPTTKRIQKLNISSRQDNTLSNKLMFSIKHLMFSIKHLTDLQHLYFNGLDREASEALADSLPTITRIQTLHISAENSPLSYKLMFSIKHLTNLQHLLLKGLDRKACDALADELPTITTIQTLDIYARCGNLSNKFVQSTKHLTNVKLLRLAVLDTDGIETLIVSIPNMTQLENLEITNCDQFIVNEAFIKSLPVTTGHLSVKIGSKEVVLDGRLDEYITSKSRFQVVAHSPFNIFLETKHHFNVD